MSHGPTGGRPSSAGGASRPNPMANIKRQFVTFSFYQFTPAFHALDVAQRDGVAKELVDLAQRWEERVKTKGDVMFNTYSLAGIRAETDFMIWFISEELSLHQQFTQELFGADLGRYVRCAVRYLSQTKRSQYVVKLDPEHSEAENRFRIVPGQRDYIFVYPFVKTRDWYLLSKRARQGIMDEHIEIGTKYRSVKINTTYSFGLDDQDFVVAFEGNEPGDFLDLVQELRETESSKFTQRDTPIYTCVRAPMQTIVAQFGASGNIEA